MAETSRRWSIVWQRRTRSHVRPLGVVVLREAGDRLEPAPAATRELVGRRVEHRRAEPNASAIAPETTPVDPPMSRIVSRRPESDLPQERDELVRIVALLVLHGLRVDQPAVVRRDERSIDVAVEVGVLAPP